MEQRLDAQMAMDVELALSKLTPEDHSDAVRLMTRAGAPVAVISRVLFLPHKIRTAERRPAPQKHRRGGSFGRAISALRRLRLF